MSMRATGYLTAGILIALPMLGVAQTAPKALEGDAMRYGQSMADALRGATGADVAFVPAGMLKSALTGRDLAGALEFPSEEVSVVKLTGAQIRLALERSVSLYPTPSPGFLYLSGMEVTFNPAGAPDKRVSSVSIKGAEAAAGTTYRVAMPASLARGGLGYFTVWSKSAVEARSSAQTLESLVKGQQPNVSESRWKATKGGSSE